MSRCHTKLSRDFIANFRTKLILILSYAERKRKMKNYNIVYSIPRCFNRFKKKTLIRKHTTKLMKYVTEIRIYLN